jgi:hypothetical protein
MDTQLTSRPRRNAPTTTSQATHINRFLALRACRVQSVFQFQLLPWHPPLVVPVLLLQVQQFTQMDDVGVGTRIVVIVAKCQV